MIRYELSAHIDCPPEVVFDFVGTNNARNHPRWEREVLEVRQTTAGPMGPGTRTVMVRRDFGRVREVPHEVAEFVPGRVFALQTLGGPLAGRFTYMTSHSNVGGLGIR
jgi:hypothetical protein